MASLKISFYLLTVLILSELLVAGQDFWNEDQFYNDDNNVTKWMYFPDGDGIPQRISLDMPPSSFLRRSYDNDDIEYRLYTRYNPVKYIILDETAQPLNDSVSHIVKKLSTCSIKLVTHGWESNADKSAVMNIKDAYMRMQDVCVIAVDWSSISESMFYPVVAYQTKSVGSHVAKFLNAITEVYGVQASRLHLIGHSLGAHVMGNAGSEYKYKPDRITGLDPARPMFEFPNRAESVKLDPSDAIFVDVIHTCGGVLGVQNSVGHADFFPNNGGAPQPGCRGFSHILDACSHSRSHVYFAESILYPDAFPAYQCKDWSKFMQKECENSSLMGDSVNKTISGRYYLITNPSIPYGRKQ